MCSSDLPDWRVPYIDFLTTKKLPEDQVQARQMVRRASAYTIINNELYKRSTSGIFLRCVEPEEGRRILNDIHSGDCGHHVGARSLVAKVLQHDFFWLTAHHDARDIVPEVRSPGSPAGSGTQNHPPNLAFRGLGAGHGGALQKGA